MQKTRRLCFIAKHQSLWPQGFLFKPSQGWGVYLSSAKTCVCVCFHICMYALHFKSHLCAWQTEWLMPDKHVRPAGGQARFTSCGLLPHQSHSNSTLYKFLRTPAAWSHQPRYQTNGIRGEGEQRVKKCKTPHCFQWMLQCCWAENGDTGMLCTPPTSTKGRQKDTFRVIIKEKTHKRAVFLEEAQPRIHEKRERVLFQTKLRLDEWKLKSKRDILEIILPLLFPETVLLDEAWLWHA